MAGIAPWRLVVMLAARGLADTDHVDGNPDLEW